MTEKRGIFIQSNKKQLLGAKIAKFAMETRGRAREHGIPVTIMEVESVPAFQDFVGKPYRKGNYDRYTFRDLQSFTMTRFMPPELMGFQGRAVVIDPDIFALDDVAPLLEMNLHGTAIGACRKKDAWDTSMMTLDCTKLAHWSVRKMLDAIAAGERSYEDIAMLRDETAPVMELPRIWNSLDALTEETRMLHTTMRLTQPWRTGLPIDFTWNPVPPLFGIIPRFWVNRPARYQPHPDTQIEKLFFELAREAYAGGAILEEEILEAIASKDIRSDFLSLVA